MKFNIGDKVRMATHPMRGIGTIVAINEDKYPYKTKFEIGYESDFNGEGFELVEAATTTGQPERSKILAEADQLINGDRAKDYGDPRDSFQRLANLWNAQLDTKLAAPLTPQDVAYCLIQLKMSRLANTPGHTDSLIDVAGYIALAGELG